MGNLNIQLITHRRMVNNDKLVKMFSFRTLTKTHPYTHTPSGPTTHNNNTNKTNQNKYIRRMEYFRRYD